MGEEKIKAPDYPGHHRNPYVQEHVALLDSILKEKPLNEASQIAESTLVGVMGRLSMSPSRSPLSGYA